MNMSREETPVIKIRLILYLYRQHELSDMSHMHLKLEGEGTGHQQERYHLPRLTVSVTCSCILCGICFRFCMQFVKFVCMEEIDATNSVLLRLVFGGHLQKAISAY